MKKLFRIIPMIMLGLLFAQCGEDDNSSDSDGTLFVNGEDFELGTNNEPNEIYNTVLVSGGGGYIVRTFTIAKDVSSTDDVDAIEVTIFQESNGDLDGTYQFRAGETVPETGEFATGAYYATAEQESFGTQNISGSVTVTDLGNLNYKLQFNNVVMGSDEGSVGSKTITGYAELQFSGF
ncbi:MAG TPA: hypothetical protein VF581_01770 [Flavobacterium sp.]|jgi:hypothetical protein